MLTNNVLFNFAKIAKAAVDTENMELITGMLFIWGRKTD